MPSELTTGLINDFKEHIVWRVICSRIEPEYKAALDKAIDEDDYVHARSAGKVRVYELILGFPDRLLKEVESQETEKVTTPTRRRRWSL